MSLRHCTSALVSFSLLAMLGASVAQADPGERYRVFHRGKWLQYFEQDGLAIAEGDILLGTAPDMARIRDAMGLTNKALVVDDTTLLWPVGPSGAHEVPYIFESGPQSNVDAAVAQFNAAFAGIIQWVPRTTQADYVTFNLVGPNGSCFSEVGRTGGKQQIGGSTVCGTGALLHEMGHAIGFWHTQSDVAQSSFLRIAYDTMDPRWRDQYFPIVDARTLDGYDYGSIMHYGPFVESTTPDGLTASTIPAGIDTGLRSSYSAADVDSVKRLYGGTPTAVTIATNPAGLQLLIDGQLRTTPVTLNWRIGSLHRLDAPPGLQDVGAYKFAFGRWNHDPSPDPKSEQEWIVEPGQGYPSEPVTAERMYETLEHTLAALAERDRRIEELEGALDDAIASWTNTA
ncbi:MAG: M12 family metallopeptidase, partial [Betaproteobacteria bacterium]